MRRLGSFESLLASTIAGSALLVALLATGAGCTLGVADDDDDTAADDDGGDNPPPPPPPPVIPLPAKYVRGSLAPLFELIAVNDERRIDPFGIALEDQDFQIVGGGFVTVEQKLDEVGAQIGNERGSGPIDLIKGQDRLRTSLMAFRGKPTDVKAVVGIDGIRKLVVPLGGDISTPGNEVAVFDVDNEDNPQLVKVGIKPIKIAPHEDGVAFVCNQYSNYISVIDVAEEDLLRRTDGTPVEIPTEYYCSDILLADKTIGGEQDRELYLFVANEWRGAVLRYDISLVTDGINDRVIDVVIDNPGDPVSTPAKYITGVGSNPNKLRLSDDQESVFVANGRGGVVAKIGIRNGDVLGEINIGAPAVDALQINQSVFIPTTMVDRGYLARNEVTPPDALQAQTFVESPLSGQREEAHPGAQFDNTLAYNFEDIRDGTSQVNLNLTAQEVYYTDNISPEENFVAEQKVLNGAEPVTFEKNEAGTLLFAAHAGSDIVQALAVNNGANFRLTEIGGGNDTFEVDARPMAMLIDEDRNELTVVNWGGETLQTFDLDTQQQLQRIDLGFGNINTQAEYPATNIEIGEYTYYNADWSNNGRKSCATCHGPIDLIGDGFPFANGATAPTAPHEVKPNFNLLTTDDYFWNGSFDNGSYASLAFAAQTRTVCEQIAFAFVEGPSTPANQRVGDPAVEARGFGNFDANCQPEPFAEPDLEGLPPNFNVPGGIADTIAAQKLDAAVQIAAAVVNLGGLAGQNNSGTGAGGAILREDVSRFMDYYSVSILRLPPNPLKYLNEAGELATDEAAKIQRGEALFTQAACVNCHDPGNTRAPYTDGLNHGVGADWNRRFVDQYNDDARVVLHRHARRRQLARRRRDQHPHQHRLLQAVLLRHRELPPLRRPARRHRRRRRGEPAPGAQPADQLRRHRARVRPGQHGRCGPHQHPVPPRRLVARQLPASRTRPQHLRGDAQPGSPRPARG